VIYVDTLQRYGSWRWGPSCHLTADTLEELHEFAESLGLQRQWFQPKRPHYDLTKAKRKLAVRLGAKEVASRELLEVCRRCC